MDGLIGLPHSRQWVPSGITRSSKGCMVSSRAISVEYFDWNTGGHKEKLTAGLESLILMMVPPLLTFCVPGRLSGSLFC
jgi:hypothetical protein